MLASEAFVTGTKVKLGVKVKGRELIGRNGSYELRESPASCLRILGHENQGLRLEDIYGLIAWSHPTPTFPIAFQIVPAILGERATW